jgi:Domain of unknown function (DUF397)
MDMSSAVWRKSSYSGANGGNCIEIAAAARTVVVRDSKEPDGPVLAFGPNVWQRFADHVKAYA